MSVAAPVFFKSLYMYSAQDLPPSMPYLDLYRNFCISCNNSAVRKASCSCINYFVSLFTSCVYWYLIFAVGVVSKTPLFFVVVKFRN